MSDMEVEGLAADRSLAEVVQAVDHGYVWFDHDLRLRGHNRAYRKFVGFEQDQPLVGRSYDELLKLLLKRGEISGGGDQDAFVADRVQTLKRREAMRTVRVRPDGSVLDVSGIPLPSGGYAFAFQDITRERRALEELRRNAKATVLAMANFSEHRDTDTGVHVLRVARLVGQIAGQLHRRGLFADVIDEAYIDQVSTGSILHDVGKVTVADRILFKAGPLTEDERASMKLHASAGEQMLSQAALMMADSRYLILGAEIAQTHHEWFDGSGYPDGLTGNEIPLSGRICAIADVFDALTSRRPYKTPWSSQQAVAQIRKQAGSQFDPAVVDAFVEVIERREQVSLVRWSDAMSVGDLHLDEQHRVLIDTINQLASAESQNDRPVVAMIIDELVAYAAFHFDYEERLLERAGYPELQRHRRIHEGFAKWIADLREEFSHKHRQQLGAHILGVLCAWLSDHILGEDQEYRSYLGPAQ